MCIRDRLGLSLSHPCRQIERTPAWNRATTNSKFLWPDELFQLVHFFFIVDQQKKYLPYHKLYDPLSSTPSLYVAAVATANQKAPRMPGDKRRRSLQSHRVFQLLVLYFYGTPTNNQWFLRKRKNSDPWTEDPLAMYHFFFRITEKKTRSNKNNHVAHFNFTEWGMVRRRLFHR